MLETLRAASVHTRALRHLDRAVRRDEEHFDQSFVQTLLGDIEEDLLGAVQLQSVALSRLTREHHYDPTDLAADIAHMDQIGTAAAIRWLERNNLLAHYDLQVVYPEDACSAAAWHLAPLVEPFR